LEEDGRQKKNVIAVVDDPISSLDTKALNYAFSLLKRTLSDTSQLIVLTHNMDFMNEAKKWLKGKAYPRDPSKSPSASLLFIATTVSPCGTISSSICELPCCCANMIPNINTCSRSCTSSSRAALTNFPT
jgi:hypothetical protein